MSYRLPRTRWYWAVHRTFPGTEISRCRLLFSTAEYVRQPDWQHGVLVVAYCDDWFNVSPVYIQRGRAIWGGEEFAA